MPIIYAQGGRLGNDSAGGVVAPSQFAAQGAIYTGNRPCFVWFRGDLHVIGYYTRPVVRFMADAGQWRLSGIKSPQEKLSVAPGALAGGSAGECLAAITFLHKSGQKVLAESNFSNVVDVGALTGEGRSWSNIDKNTAEDRVTHVRGYVSMNGNLFRMAWEAPFGISTITENTRTAALTFAGPNDFDHGITPATRFGHSFAGRMWYARSSQHPYRVWYSMAGEPQYVKPASFRDTWDKEPITAIWKGRNELLVFCQRASYMIRQFGQGADDFIMEKLDSDVGCVSHWGIQEIHNKVWFPSEDGIWIYDGGFRYLMKEVQPLWGGDWKTNKNDFLNGFSMHDRVNKIYMYATNRAAKPEYEGLDIFPGTVTYCGYYGQFEPSMQGNQPNPEWTIDMKNRFDSSGFYNSDGELVIGSCDGVIRKQDELNADDDGDLLQKELVIRTGHQLFFDPGDDLEGGKQLNQLWAYIESEATAWRIYAKGGDEQAWQGMLPDNDFWFWTATVAAASSGEIRRITPSRSGPRTYDLLYVPAGTHWFVPERVTGRGFTFEIRATAPVGLQYRGIGGLWSPGSTARGVAERTNITLSATINATDLDLNPSLPCGYYPFTISAVYNYGSPLAPVVATITAVATGGAAVNFTEQVTLNPGTLIGVSADHLFCEDDAYDVTITLEDGNGIPANAPVTGAILGIVGGTFLTTANVTNATPGVGVSVTFSATFP